MEKPIRPPQKIEVKDSTIEDAGRGVFASENIYEGEVIERCPIIVFEQLGDLPFLGSVLFNYIFHHIEKENTILICLGYGSLYNHSYEPNARYKLVDETYIEFTALKNISEGDEITVNYNFGNPEDRSSLTDYGIPPYRSGNQ